MKSSSFHKISADNRNIFYKILALIVHRPLNFVNNLNPTKNIDPKLKISYFRNERLDQQYPDLDRLSSPSRKLSDLFWMNTNWSSIKQNLGEINICDIGCGSGNYFLKLLKYSDSKINSYKGLDITENKNWENLETKYQNVEFLQYNGKNIQNLIPTGTNLIISQSAIEHFLEDITIFKQIQNFVMKSEQDIYQIHLFPSKACIKLFPFHGVRQYTLKNISKITRLFSDFCDVELTELGGENSYSTHNKFINKGVFNKDVRMQNTEKYEEACFTAIKKDLEKSKTDKPNFYALVIKSKN